MTKNLVATETDFENALIELIEQYIKAGLTNADIRGVLDARRDDDHEWDDDAKDNSTGTAPSSQRTTSVSSR